MTTDENGKIRAGDEAELRRLSVVEFFIKAAIFKEMLDARLAQIKSIKK